MAASQVVQFSTGSRLCANPGENLGKSSDHIGNPARPRFALPAWSEAVYERVDDKAGCQGLAADSWNPLLIAVCRKHGKYPVIDVTCKFHYWKKVKT